MPRSVTTSPRMWSTDSTSVTSRRSRLGRRQTRRSKKQQGVYPLPSQRPHVSGMRAFGVLNPAGFMASVTPMTDGCRWDGRWLSSGWQSVFSEIKTRLQSQLHRHLDDQSDRSPTSICTIHTAQDHPPVHVAVDDSWKKQLYHLYS